MLTMVWKKPSIGYEEVFEVRRVWLRGLGINEKSQDSNPPETIGVEFPDDITRIFDDGEFYVMNASGKTVAKYAIGQSAFVPVPNPHIPISK